MSEIHLKLAKRIAEQFAVLPNIEAIALGGSLATEAADPTSDIDLYIFTHTEIPPHERMNFISKLNAHVVLNDFWGAGNEWMDTDTGIHIDAMFWTVDWIEAQLERVLDHHQASVGYSTCFWHTVRESLLLFDRHGWFAALHHKAQQPYPEPLVHAIIAQNYPILRDTPSAYSHQLEKAIARRDLVSVNHRVAAFLAGYFDILFALNRLPNPGEKRLVDLVEKQCPKQPQNLREQIATLIECSVSMDAKTLDVLDELVDGLDELLGVEGLALNSVEHHPFN